MLWTSTFYPYGVEVFQTPLSEHIRNGESGPESWNASESDRWRSRLNSPVASVQTFWEHITVGPGHIGDVRVSDPYEVDVPVALRIDFAAGPVWMVAGIPQYPEMREAHVPGDEIMVVFTPDECGRSGSRITSSCLSAEAEGSDRRGRHLQDRRPGHRAPGAA